MNFNYISSKSKRARGAYLIQCAVEYIVTLLISDAFLAKVLKSIGLSDGDVGVISSLISFAFMMQLVSIPVLRHIKSIKRYVIITDTVSFLSCMMTFTLPLLPFADPIRHLLAFVFVACATSLRYVSFNAYYKWANSYVDPMKRGRYTSVKESVSLVVGIITSLAVGYLFDHFEKLGRINTAFSVVAIYIAALSVINFVLICQIPKDSNNNDSRADYGSVIAATFKNKAFLRILVLQCLVRFATYMTIGFLGTYKTQELGFSLSFTQIIVTVSQLGQLAFTVPIGIYSDKKSYAKGYALGCTLAVGAFLSLMLTSPATKWLIMVYTVLYGCSLAGTSANATNMLYSYTPVEYLSQTQAIMSGICGLCGFGASLVGRSILNAVQNNQNTLFGIRVYGQQVMAGISAFLFAIAIIFASKYVLKQKDLKQ